MIKIIKSFLREEKGATAPEYAMIIGLIALVSFVAYKRLGNEVRDVIGWMYIKMLDIKG